MFERLTDGTLVSEEDEDGDGCREAVDKYMKDLGQMMEGMLDLSGRSVK
jgi:hypothetical protein